ncbi:hypothetical protein TWF173_006784 [Orbilia oligospora]|nr:hypothetical protein TWF173_006784 [Orbilia oligospora]
MIPEPTETELSFLAWHHPSSGIFINPVELERYCPLDNGRLKRCTFSSCGTSSNQLGAFSSIPVEISYSILEILDIQSLTTCRAINWYFRFLVDEFLPYKSIFRDCPEVLRALLSTKSASNFTVRQIYETLCSQACSECGRFAPFLDLFTGCRNCFPCILKSPNLRALPKSTLEKRLGRRVPSETLLTVPGEYAQIGRRYKQRYRLVRLSQSMIEELQGDPHDGFAKDQYRYMPMMRVPVLGMISGGEIERGRCCQACHLGPREEIEGYQDWNTSYSRSGYLEHFKVCKMAQIARAALPQYIKPSEEISRSAKYQFQGFISDYRFKTLFSQSF